MQHAWIRLLHMSGPAVYPLYSVQVDVAQNTSFNAHFSYKIWKKYTIFFTVICSICFSRKHETCRILDFSADRQGTREHLRNQVLLSERRRFKSFCCLSAPCKPNAHLLRNDIIQEDKIGKKLVGPPICLYNVRSLDFHPRLN